MHKMLYFSNLQENMETLPPQCSPPTLNLDSSVPSFTPRTLGPPVHTNGWTRQPCPPKLLFQRLRQTDGHFQTHSGWWDLERVRERPVCATAHSPGALHSWCWSRIFLSPVPSLLQLLHALPPLCTFLNQTELFAVVWRDRRREIPRSFRIAFPEQEKLLIVHFGSQENVDRKWYLADLGPRAMGFHEVNTPLPRGSSLACLGLRWEATGLPTQPWQSHFPALSSSMPLCTDPQSPDTWGS